MGNIIEDARKQLCDQLLLIQRKIIDYEDPEGIPDGIKKLLEKNNVDGDVERLATSICVLVANMIVGINQKSSLLAASTREACWIEDDGNNAEKKDDELTVEELDEYQREINRNFWSRLAAKLERNLDVLKSVEVVEIRLEPSEVVYVSKALAQTYKLIEITKGLADKCAPFQNFREQRA